MIASIFHAFGNGAGGTANEGQGKSAERPSVALGRPTYRAQPLANGEQLLVSYLLGSLGANFPRSLLVTYYVSLKTNPFVVLTGPEGTGKAALAAGFAAAMVGRESGQFVTIGSDSWARRGGQSSYYRGIHERFGAVQLGEIFQAASAQENAGKVFLVLLKGLTLDELDLYLNRLIQVGPRGQRRLALPGVAPDEQPVVPPNCFITATLHAPRGAGAADNQGALSNAGQIEFDPGAQAPELPALPLPPVGLQRIMLGAALHDGRSARARLTAILGRPAVRRLGPSPALASGLLEAGVALPNSLRETLLTYVANSFDDEGRGLFDPQDPRRNAQRAYDSQLLQRLLWRVDWRRKALRRRLATLLGE
jgi:energy-coupling factor transporter ATP-binding protein EcfA2